MSRNTQRLSAHLSLALLCTLVLVGVRARAQEQSQIEAKDDPIFSEYKGVRLGMTADECRHKLGTPQDKGDTQDFYAFSDNETAQVNYDAQHQVTAIAIIYIGTDKAPAPKTVLGSDLTAKPDGSMYRLVRYPKAHYWVSYSRTPGDSPLVTVMMQRFKP
jgi:outer membrane protein assembly factor BamE (lipoprotein component of BamABCDE complex)